MNKATRVLRNKFDVRFPMGAWGIGLVGVLGVFSSCSRGGDEAGTNSAYTAHDLNEAEVQQRIVRNELLVVASNQDTLAKLRKTYQVEVLDAESNTYLVRGDSNQSASKFQTDLQKLGRFDWIEPNFRLGINQELKQPRDAKWLELWGLKNYGQDAPKGAEGVAGADIKALEAWTVTKGSRDIVVAVLDTGVDYSHPDLRENIWINEAEAKGVPGVDDDNNGYADDVYGWDFVSQVRERLSVGQQGDPDPMDDHGHGTHVSGTIGALGNNLEGVVGVNWNVRIMALKFLSGFGSGTSADEFRALKYVAKMNALGRRVDVINASYGGGGKSKLLEAALKEVTEGGTLFVAAAGNDSTDNDAMPHYPSNYTLPGLISVAATDNRDQVAEFSNIGFETVHLAAPGVNITSTFPLALAKKEKLRSPYQTWSGTSMATPHVAGAAALVLSADASLRGNPAELKKRLLSTVDYLPHLAGKVAASGRLNLANAVKGKSGNSPIASAQWVEENYSLETPRYPSERIDFAFKIHKPNAKAIRVHIKEAVIDAPYDVAILYDQLLRPIVNLPETVSDYWTPAVLGDTAYIKFSNAMVSVQKYLGEEEVENPDKSNRDEYPICWKEPGASKWTCAKYSKPTDPFPNFGSESIVVDKIKYVE